MRARTCRIECAARLIEPFADARRARFYQISFARCGSYALNCNSSSSSSVGDAISREIPPHASQNHLIPLSLFAPRVEWPISDVAAQCRNILLLSTRARAHAHTFHREYTNKQQQAEPAMPQTNERDRAFMRAEISRSRCARARAQFAGNRKLIVARAVWATICGPLRAVQT